MTTPKDDHRFLEILEEEYSARGYDRDAMYARGTDELTPQVRIALAAMSRAADRDGVLVGPLRSARQFVVGYIHNPANHPQARDGARDLIRQIDEVIKSHPASPAPAADAVAEDLAQALAGMIGLVTLIQARDDMPDALRAALELSHRYTTAKEVWGAYEERRETSPPQRLLPSVEAK